MTDLEKKIKEASQKYYSDGTSPLTDEQFDEALNQLRKENPDSQLLTSVGHGYDEKLDTSGQRVNHIYGPILGLDKAHNYKELDACFKTGNDVVATLKLDGLSVVLYYEHNKFVQAVTRGGSSGLSGIDITDKVNKIFDCMNCDSDIGFEFDGDDFTGAVRGEILMKTSSYDQFVNDHPDSEVKNPRNAAAGILNRKEISDDLKYLTIVIYSLVAYERKLTFSPEIQEFSRKTGLPIVPTIYHLKLKDEEEFDSLQAKQILEELKSLVHSQDKKYYGIDYPYDGIVFTANYHYDEETCEVKWEQQAFKFPSEIKIARVKGVEWSMTKTHRCVPRINIEETQLAGTSVNYCTGNNAQFILDNEIGKDSVIKVTKSGEIIPQVVEVVQPSLLRELVPTYCPDCGRMLSKKGVDLVCENPDCTNANIQDLLAYVNAIAPMDNFGDTLFLKYISKFVDNISDLTVEWMIDKLEETPGTFHMLTDSIQGELFNNKMEGVEKNQVKLSTMIEGLNVPRLGSITSKKIERECPEIVGKLFNRSLGIDKDENLFLDVAQKIGDANAKSIEENIFKFARLEYVWDRIIFDSKEEKGKVAITGKLSVKRSQFEDELREAGYLPVSSITKDTIYLITDNPDSNSDKNKKADEYGVEKISEKQFRETFLN